MNNDQLDDLKQFITTTVGQSEARVKTEIVSELRSELYQVRNELRNEMREGFASIGDIVTSHNDQLDDHETRLTKLETRAV